MGPAILVLCGLYDPSELLWQDSGSPQGSAREGCQEHPTHTLSQALSTYPLGLLGTPVPVVDECNESGDSRNEDDNDDSHKGPRLVPQLRALGWI